MEIASNSQATQRNTRVITDNHPQKGKQDDKPRNDKSIAEVPADKEARVSL